MKKRIAEIVLPAVMYGIVPLSIILYFALSFPGGEKEYTLFPGEDSRAGTYGDYSETGGKSVIEAFSVTDQRITFTYTLKSGFVNPYAGFAVRRDGWLNLEPFDALKIRIGSTRSRSMRVFLLTKIPGYSVDGDYNTYLQLQKEIAVWEECLEYTVRFADLYTPEWWFEREMSENDPRLYKDLTKVVSISVQSGTTQPVDVMDTVTVEGISFYKNDRMHLFISVFLMIFYSIAIALFFLLKKYRNELAKKTKKVVLAYADISPDHRFDEEAIAIVKYIGENYHKRDLTVESVSRSCLVPVMRIPQYIKKYFDLSFPQYLNAIRLAEAKRLLRETDLMISEIAFRIGFSSIPHFNRVFKDNERVSPKDFRRSISLDSLRSK